MPPVLSYIYYTDLPAVDNSFRYFVSFFPYGYDVQVPFFSCPERWVVIALVPVIANGTPVLKINDPLTPIPAFDVDIGITSAAAHDSKVAI